MRRPSRDELGGLYGGPFHDFVQRRQELSRALRQAGLREEAGRVGKLPKPTFSAWLANYLYWHQKRLFRDLLKAGRRLRLKQQEITAGQGLSALHEPRQAVQEAIGHLIKAAREETSRLGRPWTTQTEGRVLRTLETIARTSQENLDPPLGEFVADLTPRGFDALLALPLPPSSQPDRGQGRQEKESPDRGGAGERKPSGKGRPTGPQPGAAARLARARRLTGATSIRDRAQQAFNESRSKLEGLAREREDGQRESKLLQDRLHALRGELAQVERRLEKARASHERKVVELERAERALGKLVEGDQ